MARDFQIAGETLITVKGNGAFNLFAQSESGASANTAALWTLGLSVGDTKVIPNWKYAPVNTDGYGKEIPGDLMWQLASCDISMTLIHYDDLVLDAVLAESMGGKVRFNNPGDFAGAMADAGTLMGNLIPVGVSGCHYFSLGLTSQQNGVPWRFPAVCLSEPPITIPLGTTASKVDLNFRAYPYPEASVSQLNPINFEGNLNANSNQINNTTVNATLVLAPGMPITGGGLPAGTVITNIVNASTILISYTNPGGDMRLEFTITFLPAIVAVSGVQFWDSTSGRVLWDHRILK